MFVPALENFSFGGKFTVVVGKSMKEEKRGKLQGRGKHFQMLRS